MPFTLIDRIYEAALLPDLWPGTLDAVAQDTGFACAEVNLVLADGTPRWTATDRSRDALDRFVAEGHWRGCTRRTLLAGRYVPGFVRDVDWLPAEVAKSDPTALLLAEAGLGWQVAAPFALPSGEMAVVTLARELKDGPPDRAALDRLDALRPHFGRAALLAARLAMQRARATVDGLTAFGLAAALLGPHGHVRCTNAAFDALSDLFLPAAGGALKIGDAAAQALFVAAMAEPAVGRRSIPVVARDDRPAAVLHLSPLTREAGDLMQGPGYLLVATLAGQANVAPPLQLLTGLFDLTPAEARLAAAMAEGKALAEAARGAGVTVKTARTYLERIFAKTGTHRQADLLALLRSTQPFN